MAIPWLRLIKSVPWRQVAARAPEIADLAKRVWSSTYNKYPTAETEVVASQDSVNQGFIPFVTEDQRIVTLEEKLAVTEATLGRQHHQLIEALEIITSLAEQNTQLIKAIEINRVRILRLTAFSVLIAVVAACSLFFALR